MYDCAELSCDIGVLFLSAACPSPPAQSTPPPGRSRSRLGSPPPAAPPSPARPPRPPRPRPVVAPVAGCSELSLRQQCWSPAPQAESVLYQLHLHHRPPRIYAPAPSLHTHTFTCMQHTCTTVWRSAPSSRSVLPPSQPESFVSSGAGIYGELTIALGVTS